MISKETHLALIFNKVLSTDLNFVVWQLPFSDEIQIIISRKKDTFKYTSLEALKLESSMFLFAPFQTSTNNPIYAMIPTLAFKLKATNKETLKDIDALEKKEIENKFQSNINPTSVNAYKKIFNQLFKLKNWEKVVLSSYDLINWYPNDLCKPFLKLCENSRNSYNYLLKIADEIWIGASPEKLLNVQNNRASTIALAATQKIIPNKNESEYEWNGKDFNEHNIVVDYIQDKLEHLNFEKQKTKTIFTGQLAHLHTEFVLNIEHNNDFDITSFIKQMHPTPAVAGFPKSKSIQIINSIENYNRSYYTGFLGTVTKNKTDIFVNLRCAKQYASKLCFFAGGGIVPESIADLEWNEIKIKIDNLKRYFN